MKTVSVVISVAFVLVASAAIAQDAPGPTPLTLSGSISTGDLAPTPEMWFYEQYKHDYQDPKQAVRVKAEFRTAQRQRRMAAKKWFGFSNQRPRCSSDPFHGDWSPTWTSNNPSYPFRWQGMSRPLIVLQPNSSGSVVR